MPKNRQSFQVQKGFSFEDCVVQIRRCVRCGQRFSDEQLFPWRNSCYCRFCLKEVTDQE